MIKALMHWREDRERERAEYAVAVAKYKQQVAVCVRAEEACKKSGNPAEESMRILFPRSIGSFDEWIARKREQKKRNKQAVFQAAAAVRDEKKKPEKPRSFLGGPIIRAVIIVGAFFYSGWWSWTGVVGAVVCFVVLDFLARTKRNEETLEKIQQKLDRPTLPTFREN